MCSMTTKYTSPAPGCHFLAIVYLHDGTNAKQQEALPRGMIEANPVLLASTPMLPDPTSSYPTAKAINADPTDLRALSMFPKPASLAGVACSRCPLTTLGPLVQFRL